MLRCRFDALRREVFEETDAGARYNDIRRLASSMSGGSRLGRPRGENGCAQMVAAALLQARADVGCRGRSAFRFHGRCCCGRMRVIE